MRTDLYYALAPLTIDVPPLHERAGDIPDLVTSMLGAGIALTPPALAALQSYAWPGQVRELRHVLDYAAAASKGEAILLQHLPPPIAACAGLTQTSGEFDSSLARWLQQAIRTDGEAANYDALLDRIEAVMLRHLLAQHDGKPTHIAAALKMNRATLRQKLRRAGLATD